MQHIKYLIVGQGLAGTLLSFCLSKRQIPHIVIASKTLPSASAVAAGIFNPLVFKRLTKSWIIDDLLPEMHQLYAEFELLLQTKLIYSIPIAKPVSHSQKNWWMERIQTQKLHNYFDGFLPANALPGLNDVHELAIIKNSGYVDLVELIVRYREYLQLQNSLIVDDFNYSNLHLSASGISWQGITAEKIIFCEGSFAVNNPYFPAKVFYLAKGDVLLAQISGLTDKYILNNQVFILPKGNQKFLIGSNYLRDNLFWEPQAETALPLIEKAQNMINLPIKVISHQAGIRPTVMDRRPVLGQHPEHNAITFFNGLGTKGVMLAPYFARQMVRFLEEREHLLSPEVNILRFF